MTRVKKQGLEDYINFYEDPSVGILSMDQLHEMNLMQDSPGSIKREGDKALLNPTRSTLRDHAVCPCAALTVDEVKDGVRCAGWEECPIGSILAVGLAAPPSPESLSRSTSVAELGGFGVGGAQKRRTMRSGFCDDMDFDFSSSCPLLTSP